MENFYGQAESGGSLLKIDLCTMLCSKKTFNFESFEFPSWEFKNIFWGVYPHQTRAPCTICIPPNRKGHIDPSFPQGVKVTMRVLGCHFWVTDMRYVLYYVVTLK